MALYGDSRPMVTQTTGGSGATAVVTLAADSQRKHAINLIHWVYNGGTPGTKSLTIAYTQNGVATTITYAIAHTVSVIKEIYLYGYLVGDVNTAVTITGDLLAAQTNTVTVFHT